MADNGLSISRGNGVNPLEKCTVQVGPAATRSSQEGRTLLQGLQPLDVWHGHAAELASPEVVVGVGESMSSTQIFDRDLSLSLPQTPNDLDHGQPLLLCQSPFLTGLDSNSWCDSIKGKSQESRSPLFFLSRDVFHAEPGGPSQRHPGQNATGTARDAQWKLLPVSDVVPKRFW